MKLVRDRIDAIPWVKNPETAARLRAEHLGWVAPDSPEYRRLLRAKLLEECAELLDADQRGDPDAVLEEAADVFEVLLTMVALAGRPFDSRHEARLKLAGRAGQKHFDRGGFLQGRTWSGPERAGHPASLPDVHAAPQVDVWTHGTRLGREHRSVRQHLIEDHGENPAKVERWSDGAVHGAHDGAHGATWAYAQNLPHPAGGRP